jgi:UDP-glucose 4-epimerase
MNNKTQKVLVTGGAGFIGSHLVDALLDQHCEVMVLDNFSTGKKNYLSKNNCLHIIEGDVCDSSVVNQAANSVDVIVHLAAISSVQKSIEAPQMTHNVNVGGTLNVLEAARAQKVKRVLFASSAAVYGDTPTLPAVENAKLNPLTPYAIDKLSSEVYLDFYRRDYGVETASFRFFNVFGERQDPASSYSGVIGIFAARVLENKPLVIYGDGEQTRDFIYVKDAVSVLVQAVIKQKICTDTINVANGKSISLNKLVDLLREIFKKDIKVNYEPVRSGDIRHSLASIDCLMQHYKKEETSIPEGLARLITSLVTN